MAFLHFRDRAVGSPLGPVAVPIITQRSLVRRGMPSWIAPATKRKVIIERWWPFTFSGLSSWQPDGAGRGSDHNPKVDGSTGQAFLDSFRYEEKGHYRKIMAFLRFKTVGLSQTKESLADIA